jgi:zinc protease
LAEVKQWLSDALRSSYLEIGVVGDFDPKALISMVAATFGTLPERAATRPQYVAQRRIAWTAPQDKVFRFTSKIPKALLAVCWPSTDSRQDIRLSRQCGVLADILGERVREKVRVELGQTYSPTVYSNMSLTFAEKGEFACLFPCEAKDAAKLGQIVRELAGRLATEGVTPDELHRARQPRLKNAEEVRRRNDWWLSYVVEAQSYPERLQWIGTAARDLQEISVADVNRLAKTYLRPERSILVSAIPEAPPAPIAPSRTVPTRTVSAP